MNDEIIKASQTIFIEFTKLKQENMLLIHLLEIAERAITGQSPEIELPAERLAILDTKGE